MVRGSGRLYLFDRIDHAFSERCDVAHTGGTAVSDHLKPAETHRATTRHTLAREEEEELCSI